jgi:AraC-like DNA-binding protein
MSSPSGSGDVSLQVLLPMLAAFPGLGLDADDFMRRIGLAPDAARDPNLRVPRPLVTTVLEELADECGQPSLGIALAVAIPFGTFAALDFYIASSATTREAFQRGCQAFQVFTSDLAVILEEGADTSEIVWRYKQHVPRIQHIVEFALAITALRAFQVVGPDFRYRSVHFAHRRPPDTKMHASTFRAPVHFDEPFDKFVFDSSWLDRPCIATDPRTSAALHPLVNELERKSVSTDPFLARVRSAVGAHVHMGEHGVTATADNLGLTLRVLQRKLAEHRTSYRGVLDDVRRTTALRLLRDGKSVGDVAKAIGLGSANALYRAYRRWTGESLGKTST